MEPIADYMTMIKYHEPEDFAGGHFPTPLEALGVPDGFFDDNDGVDTAAETMALSFFNEARAFIIAHELGHIRYNHSSAGASFAQLQQHERQADAFALDALARAEVVPMGAFLLFLAWANYHDNRWDYESDQSWQASLAEHTHPLTPERMQALATALIARVGSYQSGDRVVITMIANEMANLAALAADEDFQQSVRIVGAAEASIALRSLQSCCVPQNPGTTAVQPFSGTYIGDYVRYTVEGPESLSIRTELRRSGDNVSGTFDFGLGPGTISGLVQGTTLTFSWRWAWTSGQGIMDSSDAGYSFSGAWGYRSSYSNGGTWSGQRTP